MASLVRISARRSLAVIAITCRRNRISSRRSARRPSRDRSASRQCARREMRMRPRLMQRHVRRQFQRLAQLVRGHDDGAALRPEPRAARVCSTAMARSSSAVNGSSSSSTEGSCRNARATASRCRMPRENSRTRPSRTRSRPVRSSHSARGTLRVRQTVELARTAADSRWPKAHHRPRCRGRETRCAAACPVSRGRAAQRSATCRWPACENPAEDAQQRGLARAVAADQRQALSLGNFERRCRGVQGNRRRTSRRRRSQRRRRSFFPFAGALGVSRCARPERSPERVRGRAE